MRRIVLFLGFVVLLLAVRPAAAANEQRLGERVLGDPSAPVTIIEYSSLTCPHCASFHIETLPRIKAEYIDTGKAKLIFRDFPLEPRAAAAAMLARCVDPARYFAFLDLLFRDQKAWATAADPLAELKLRARLANLSGQDVDACLADKQLLQALQDGRDKAAAQYKIESTPSFLIDDRTVSGAAPYDTFKQAIDAALKNKGIEPPKSESAPAPGTAGRQG